MDLCYLRSYLILGEDLVEVLDGEGWTSCLAFLELVLLVESLVSLQLLPL